MNKARNSKAKLKPQRDFSGVITALVTPFKKGRIDFKSLKRLVRQQLDGGVQGFVVNGTTGESPTLSVSEVAELFRFVKKESDGAVPLILGTGSNCTATTIINTQRAQKLKADAALVVVPYYNKPPQRALVAHYTAVAKSTTLPILMYNVPGRTVISMADETILQLAKIKNIVGIKEASGDIARIRSLYATVPKDFLLTSGDDATCLDFMLAGGQGVISVISHVIPTELRQFSDAARAGNKNVTQQYSRYDKLNRLLSLEANPIPVKMMLSLMGIIDSAELRLPLLALEGENKSLVQVELKELGLI